MTDKLTDLRFKADDAKITARQTRAATEAAQNPSDREYAERQARSAEQRAATALKIWLGAKRRADKAAKKSAADADGWADHMRSMVEDYPVEADE